MKPLKNIGREKERLFPEFGFGKMKTTQHLSQEDISRIIEMAWEDRTPFEAIAFQFGLAEKDVKFLMQKEMTSSSYKMWRKRVNGRKTKHKHLRNSQVIRFKAPHQK